MSTLLNLLCQFYQVLWWPQRSMWPSNVSHQKDMIISSWLGKIRISPGPSRHSIVTLDNPQLCFLRSLWHPARVCPLDVMDTIQMPHKCGQKPVTIWRSMSQVRKKFHSHNCFLTWEPFITSSSPLRMFPVIMAEGSSWLLWSISRETMILSEQDMRVICLS